MHKQTYVDFVGNVSIVARLDIRAANADQDRLSVKYQMQMY